MLVPYINISDKEKYLYILYSFVDMDDRKRLHPRPIDNQLVKLVIAARLIKLIFSYVVEIVVIYDIS